MKLSEKLGPKEPQTAEEPVEEAKAEPADLHKVELDTVNTGKAEPADLHKVELNQPGLEHPSGVAPGGNGRADVLTWLRIVCGTWAPLVMLFFLATDGFVRAWSAYVPWAPPRWAQITIVCLNRQSTSTLVRIRSTGSEM